MEQSHNNSEFSDKDSAHYPDIVSSVSDEMLEATQAVYEDLIKPPVRNKKRSTPPKSKVVVTHLDPLFLRAREIADGDLSRIEKQPDGSYIVNGPKEPRP